MRIIIAIALVFAAGAWTTPAQAADLNVLHNGHYGPITTSRHFGKRAPWSSRAERPPRKGRFWHDGPVPRTVNALVPMRGFRGRPTPWTEAWYAYCAARWPSFNPKTGTIRTPDGVRMCM